MNTVKYIQCINLEKYLDEELPDSDHRVFESHLADCDTCREYIDNWKYVTYAYQDWTAEQIGYRPMTPTQSEVSSFVADIKNKIAVASDEAATQQRMPHRFAIWPVAVALVIGTAFFLYYRTFSTSAPNVEAPVLSTPSTNNSTPSKALSTTQCVVTRFQNDFRISDVQAVKRGHLFSAAEDERLLVKISDDIIGLDKSGQLQFEKGSDIESLFQLQRGFAAFKVSRRNPGSHFVVTAADVRITVVGTQFSVHLDNDSTVTVSVSEGTVLATQDDEQLLVSAGNQVVATPHRPFSKMTTTDADIRAIDKLLDEEQSMNTEDTNHISQHSDSSKTHVSKHNGILNVTPDLFTWRQLILDGRISEADFAIRKYLLSVPNDADALMLLATCQKKSGNMEEAFHTYNKVISTAKPSVANRARYIAGEIAQNQLGKDDLAVELFDAYLRNASAHSPNIGEAKLRLSKALLGTGNHNRAKTLLQEIIMEYGRAPVANRARSMLESTR